MAGRGGIARVVAGGVAPAPTGVVAHSYLANPEETLQPLNGTMIDDTIAGYYHEAPGAQLTRRQMAVNAAREVERRKGDEDAQKKAAAEVLAGKNPTLPAPPPWVAPRITAHDNGLPPGERVTIDYGSVEDPLERVRARDRLFQYTLGETPRAGQAADILAANAELENRKTAIRADMNSKAFYESVEKAYEERDLAIRRKALYDSAASELTSAPTGELVAPPNVVAVAHQTVHNFPDEKVVKRIVAAMKDPMSTTLDSPLNWKLWFQKLASQLSASSVSDLGALSVIARVVVGSLSFIVDTEIAKPNPNLETCWFELQREVAITRNPARLQQELVKVTARKPLCPAMVYRTIHTLVGLLYNGSSTTDTLHVINTTRQMWINMLTRYYPIYVAQILKKDAASKALMQQEIEKASAVGGQLDPRVVSAYDPIEVLYRASRDAIPKWNEGAAEEKARSKEDAANVAVLGEESKVDVQVVQQDGTVATIAMDAEVAQGYGLWDGNNAEVNALSDEEDDRPSRGLMKAKNKSDQMWEQMGRLTTRDVGESKPTTRGRKGAKKASVNTMAALFESMLEHRGTRSDSELFDAAVAAAEASTEGFSPKGIPSQSMNAPNAFARNLDNVMGPQGGGRGVPQQQQQQQRPGGSNGGGYRGGGFNDYGSGLCFSCNRASHRWRACDLFPEMAQALGLSKTVCAICQGRHHGPCRTHPPRQQQPHQQQQQSSQ